MKFIFFSTLLLFSVNGFAFIGRKLLKEKESFYQFDDDNLKKQNRPNQISKPKYGGMYKNESKILMQ